MAQTKKEAPTTNIINTNWILLDIFSANISTRKKNLLHTIQPYDSGEELRAYSNGRNQDYNHTKTFKMLPFEAFFNEKSLEIILSFATVSSKFRITIDTELGPLINVQLHDGTQIIFNKYRGGLYYFDTPNKAFYEEQTKDYTFLNTLDNNR